MMRINRYLASCGLASRRGVEEIITAGRVTVNGKRITRLGVSINESKDIVRVDGRHVHLQEKQIYILFNKPKGVVTTARDELGRKNVLDIVKVKERIFPVGRLDRNSEGLLLLTNDGELANRLLHPSSKVYKTYRVRLDHPLREKDMDQLVSGMNLDDGVTARCRARFYTDDPQKIELQIHEGRNHIVRRMFAALGYNVKALKRTQFGPLSLKNLGRGQWRWLTPPEIFQLRQIVSRSRVNAGKK
ncbi:rRNA pseudouridine synthase [candidate division KSB1 bacterium]|nr:rRNA pseudouridine synthase [candidate division KSB1 bacterium]RQW01106.1 MAG: rRNA pseudouridine synthase [candidate division KSB1 bacterium]